MFKIMKEIYEDVFNNTFSKSCYVFLCGGTGKEHIRSKVRLLLEKEQFQIFYPEDIFMEMLNRNKKYDLLEFENMLAENSDIICIICESFGSAVELGAFTQNDNLKKKMVIVISKKYKRDKSFIMMGPVKHLKKNDDCIVIFNPDDLKSLGIALSKVFRKLHKQGASNKNRSFDTLSAYIAFVPIVVYFFQTINRKTLFNNLKAILNECNTLPIHYKELFNAAIKYLIKSRTLVVEFDIDMKDETFSLSPKGYQETLDHVMRSSASQRTVLHDRIRCAILKGQLNN